MSCGEKSSVENRITINQDRKWLAEIEYQTTLSIEDHITKYHRPVLDPTRIRSFADRYKTEA